MGCAIDGMRQALEEDRAEQKRKEAREQFRAAVRDALNRFEEKIISNRSMPAFAADDLHRECQEAAIHFNATLRRITNGG